MILSKPHSFSIMVIVFWGMLNSVTAWAQGIGEQAEMDRLEEQAQNLTAQNDPEGAALAIGKAAMMADLLTRDSQEPQEKRIYQAAAHLFRGQELGLRALALFERTGGTLPAPAGICHYIVQGNNKLHDSRKLLEMIPSTSSEAIKDRWENLLQKNEEWENLLMALHEDFECKYTN